MFILQFIRYSRACSSYECFILKAARLSYKLLGHEYVREHLKSSLKKFYDWYGDLIKRYEVFLSQMLHDILGYDHIQRHPQLIRHFTKWWPFNLVIELDLIRPWTSLQKFWEVFIEHLQQMQHANRVRSPLRTPVPVIFGTCTCSNVDTILSWTGHVSTLWISTSLSTSIF